MALSMETQGAPQPIDRMQVTRGAFPYNIEFAPTGPLFDPNAVQPIQAAGRRYFGNVDQLLERERQRLRLEFTEAGLPVPTPGSGGTPGTGPAPLGPQYIDNSDNSDRRRYEVVNGGYSGDCR